MPDRSELGCLARAAHVHAFGECRERGAAGLEGHDLAIEEHVLVVLAQPDQLGITHRDVAAAARGQEHLAIAHVGEDAHAVPLDLVHPIRTVGHALGHGGEHGLQGWHEDSLTHRSVSFDDTLAFTGPILSTDDPGPGSSVSSN